MVHKCMKTDFRLQKPRPHGTHSQLFAFRSQPYAEIEIVMHYFIQLRSKLKNDKVKIEFRFVFISFGVFRVFALMPPISPDCH